MSTKHDGSYVEFLKTFKNLLEVGAYPPPYGGVTVHMYRLQQLLSNSVVFNLLKKEAFKGQNFIRLFFHLLGNKYDAVHLHSLNVVTLSVCYVAKKLKGFQLIVTDHNPRLFLVKSKLGLSLIKFFIARVDVLIAVGDHVLTNYESNLKQLPGKVYINNAFLPPPEKERQEIWNQYPTSLHAFIEQQSPVVIANASRLVFHEGDDLYGLDMTIKLIDQLRDTHKNIGLIFAFSEDLEKIENKTMREHLNNLDAYITEHNLQQHVHYLVGQKELWPLLDKVELFVRPTNTDGDSVSIREALYFKCKVLASDVCARPEGVHTFETRNQEDFYQKSLKLI